jgi:hypothetical protein
MVLYYVLDCSLPPLSALPVLDKGGACSVYLDFMCLLWPNGRPPGYRYDSLCKCKGGPKSLFKEDNGWNNWPANAKEKDVLE